MKPTHLHFPKAHERYFQLISQMAHQLNQPAYVIGGYVRDLLLDRPSKDIDIVCVGSGIALAEAVGKAVGTSVVVFAQFGTAMLRIGEVEVEFVGARKESLSRRFAQADCRKRNVGR